ncbi:MAG: saccharopine dehydrogenase C-terminal domain-containing protein [Candidatus Bathyarchaeaceae archaeon]
MEVAILGMGAVGGTVARFLAKSKYVDKLLLADINEARARELKSKIESDKVWTEKVDASNRESLAKVVKGNDLIINATVADYNLEVMNAAFNAGSNYIDFVGGGPREVLGTPEIKEQLALNDQWAERGLLAVVGLGVSPGIMGLIARKAYDEVDELRELHIKCYGGGSVIVEGYAFSPLFNPATLMDECLCPVEIYRNGRYEHVESLSGEETLNFPEGLGSLKTWYIHHDEIETFPRFLHKKGLRAVDFRYALHPQVYKVFEVFKLLGLNRRDKINVKGVKVVPRDLVLALVPEPSDLAGKARGITCIGVEVVGSKGSCRVHFFEYVVMDHQEAAKRYGCTGTIYLTAMPTVLFTGFLAQGRIDKKGVVPSEALDPKPFFEAFPSVGIPVKRIDLTKSN